MYSVRAVAGKALIACTLACALNLPGLAAQDPVVTTSSISQHGLPVVFEPNLGQAPSSARFLARTSDGETLFTQSGVEILQHGEGYSQNFSLNFVGADPTVPPAANPKDATGGEANYYTGQDKSKWVERVPLFRKIRYSKIYPGTDLVFHGSGGRLEYDFELTPGASPALLQIDTGEDSRLAVQTDGSLEITVAGHKINLLAPKAFQGSNSGQNPIPVSYRVFGPHRFGFEIGAYDRDLPLVIDPVVSYANFLSFNNSTSVTAIAADTSGDLILTGNTFATNFPVVDGLGSSPQGTDQVFVTKMDPAGETILYSTYLPSSGFSSATAVTTDSAGNAYVAGQTGGSDFPVTSDNLGVCANFCNAGFVTKLNSAGQIVYSAILASGQVLPKAVTVNASGNAYVAGLAADDSLLTRNAFQAAYGSGECTSCNSAFFAELNTLGNGFVFASYLGSTNSAQAIALDSAGNIYVAGAFTGPTGTSIPLKNQFQSAVGEYFLTKFSSDGKTLLFGSYLGGYSFSSGGQTLAGLAIGPDGSVYLGGNSGADAFPWTINAYRHPIAPGNEAYHMFAMAFNSTLTALKYSTYLGDGSLIGMGVDVSGNLYGAGFSSTPIIPKAAVVADVPTGGFFIELSPAGQAVQSSAFGGRAVQEVPSAMTVDAGGNVYLAGNPGGINNPFSYCCAPDDAIAVGAAGHANQPGSLSPSEIQYSAFFAKISPQAQPQISLGSAAPFLPLRNVGSADLHIESITFSGGLARSWGNCGTTIPAGTSCILTVTDAKGKLAQGSVTITSDASPAVQTFTPIVSSNSIGAPVGDLLWINTNQLNFPPQQVGVATAPHPLYLWNLGAADLAISGVAATHDLSQTNNCTAAIKPGAYCSVDVIWKPSTNNIQDSISFTADGQKFQGAFYLSGSPNPLLLSQNNSINFGTQVAGTPGLPRSITITNVSGSAAPSPVISTSGGGFTYTKTCGATLQPQQSCLLSALFTPVLSGNLDVTDTVEFSGGASATVYLTGIAQAPVSTSAAPLQLQWPATQIGASSTQTVTLTNNSGKAFSVASITFSLPDYSETDTCHVLVPASGSCTIQVKFQPQQYGPRNDAMSIDAGLSSAQSISLAGAGQFPMVFGVSGIDFGSNNLLSKATAPFAVQMANVTKAALPYNLSVSGPFSMVNPCANPLPAGTHCAISVTYTPSSTDQQTGALTLANPGVVGNFIPLIGAGFTIPTISVAKNLYFPSTQIGGTSIASLTISNTGSRSLAIGRFTFSGANAANFNVPSGQCSTIPGLGSCTVQVNFTPTVPGTDLAVLDVNGDSTNSPQTVALTALALGPAVSFSPTSIKFANQTEGTTSVPATVTVKNTGNDLLNIAGITVPAGFSQTNTCGGVIYAGSFCQISITFAPTAAATYSGKLTITDNASGGSQSVTLAGTAIAQ